MILNHEVLSHYFVIVNSFDVEINTINAKAVQSDSIFN